MRDREERLWLVILLTGRMLARRWTANAGARITRRSGDHCEPPQVSMVACLESGAFDCGRAARKHDYHRSMGLFTPSPPRFRTCV